MSEMIFSVGLPQSGIAPRPVRFRPGPPQPRVVSRFVVDCVTFYSVDALTLWPTRPVSVDHVMVFAHGQPLLEMPLFDGTRHVTLGDVITVNAGKLTVEVPFELVRMSPEFWQLILDDPRYTP